MTLNKRKKLIVNQHIPSFNTLLDYFKIYCENNNILLPRLNIAFGDYYQSIIYNTELYFRNAFRPEWLEDEKIKKAIRDVDKSTVINGNGDKGEYVWRRKNRKSID